MEMWEAKFDAYTQEKSAVADIMSSKKSNNTATATSRLFHTTTDATIGIATGQIAGTLFIGTASTRTSDIQIGATGCNTVSRGPLVGNLGVTTTTINSITPANTFNILPSHTGPITIGSTASSVTLGTTVFGSSITAPSSSSIINLFNNISGLTGKVNMCSSLIFSEDSIASTTANDTITLTANNDVVVNASDTFDAGANTIDMYSNLNTIINAGGATSKLGLYSGKDVEIIPSDRFDVFCPNVGSPQSQISADSTGDIYIAANSQLQLQSNGAAPADYNTPANFPLKIFGHLSASGAHTTQIGAITPTQLVYGSGGSSAR
jgi:hypothetical protein